MVVVTHDRIGTQVNGINRAKQFDPVNNPLPAVFEAVTTHGVLAAQEGAPHTARNAVVVRSIIQ